MGNYEYALRYARKVKNFGEDPKCAICGYPGLWVMTRYKGKPVCYECNLELQGKPTVEGHHVYGRQNDPNTIVTLPGNFHRLLTETHECYGYGWIAGVEGLLILILAFLADYCIRKDTRSKIAGAT
jgi:hypothetical protein